MLSRSLLYTSLILCVCARGFGCVWFVCINYVSFEMCPTRVVLFLIIHVGILLSYIASELKLLSAAPHAKPILSPIFESARLLRL